MAMLSVDPRLTWELPHIRPCDRKYVNKMEEDFAAFLTKEGIAFSYEPRFYFLKGSTRKLGYCADFYLPKYDMRVEIYSAKTEATVPEGSIIGPLTEEEWIEIRRRRRKSKGRLLTRKRRRIKLLSRYSGLGTVLLHPWNWTNAIASRVLLEEYIEDARTAGILERQKQIDSPEVSEWEL